jgi:hypothetical protein
VQVLPVGFASIVEFKGEAMAVGCDDLRDGTAAPAAEEQKFFYSACIFRVKVALHSFSSPDRAFGESVGGPGFSFPELRQHSLQLLAAPSNFF